jgi:hypothetical protein|tara:strand:+ start:969 stop:1247 length:279 start_codon:yes stop_codon:yes gene_type:complete
MTKMPEVRKEVAYSIYKTIDGLEGLEEKSKYLSDFWNKFRKEQPELHTIITKELMGFEEKDQMGAFAHGVWLVWAALKSQQEADEMNENWGS